MLNWLLNLSFLSYTETVVALGAAIMGALAGLVGSLAVLRRRSLVGDAMSHAALPGVCAAFLVTGGLRDTPVLMTGALLAGALAALVIVLLENYSRIPPDAAIGVVLSVSFSIGIVLLTVIAQRSDASQAGLENYLFGQAASLLVSDLRLMLIILIAALVMLIVLRQPLRVTLFDRPFAHSVGVSVVAVDIASTLLLVTAAVTGLQVVGAILMVAMLIAPGVSARQWTTSLNKMLTLATILGAFIGASGALIAARLQTPTGPMIVLAAAAIVAFSLAFAPQRGVISQLRVRANLRRRSV